MIEQLRFDANFIGLESPKFGIVSELAHGLCPPFQRNTIPANAAKLRLNVAGATQRTRKEHPIRSDVYGSRLTFLSFWKTVRSPGGAEKPRLISCWRQVA
jgi:hypothetical protein